MLSNSFRLFFFSSSLYTRLVSLSRLWRQNIGGSDSERKNKHNVTLVQYNSTHCLYYFENDDHDLFVFMRSIDLIFIFLYFSLPPSILVGFYSIILNETDWNTRQVDQIKAFNVKWLKCNNTLSLVPTLITIECTANATINSLNRSSSSWALADNKIEEHHQLCCLSILAHHYYYIFFLFFR